MKINKVYRLRKPVELTYLKWGNINQGEVTLCPDDWNGTYIYLGKGLLAVITDFIISDKHIYKMSAKSSKAFN